MKRFCYQFYPLLFLLAFASCTGLEKDPDRPVPKSIFSGEKAYELVGVSEEGDGFGIEVSFRDEITGKSEESTRKSTILRKIWLESNTLKDYSGNLYDEYVIKRFRKEITGPGETDTLDTQAPPVWGDYQDGLWRTLLNKPFRIQYDSTGKMKRSMGFQYLFWRMFPDTAYSADDYLMETIQYHDLLPDKPVKTGAHWDKALRRHGFYPGTRQVRVSLRNVREGKAFLGMKGEVFPMSNAKYVWENGVPKKYSLEGSVEGDWVFLLEDGYYSSGMEVSVLNGTVITRQPDGSEKSSEISIKRSMTFKKDQVRAKKPSEQDTPGNPL